MHPGLHAQAHPDKPALILPARNVTVTYRALDEGSNRAAQLFRSLGLGPGDGIALLLENHPRFYEVVWSTTAAPRGTASAPSRPRNGSSTRARWGALMGTVHILDEEFRELPVGEAGTIYFEGGNAFEYHKDPAKTASSRSPQGWSTLGDIGYLDADGYLYLTDRKAHMIISGGVNIYPQECENLLATHPKVADCAVIGVPNEDFGEEVKAVVQPVDLGEAGPELAEELIAFCRTHLSHIKCPRSIDFEAELPRHPTGKLYKRALRDRYWQGRTSRIV
jgi:acyl-CoA synthetase (AMP-forming)/AMP-acid ligase II